MRPSLVNMIMCSAFLLTFATVSYPSLAEGTLREKLLELRKQGNSAPTGSFGHTLNKSNESFGGRDFIVYIPKTLPAVGNRSMVVVLHGGMGSASNIKSFLDMDSVADRYGFIVTYLNGTQVAEQMPEMMRGWNAGGGCCGLPYRNKVDDVRYIQDAAAYLVKKYGIDSRHVYGMGHSNGAMMTQRLMCETDLYQAAVPVSGPLGLDVKTCPTAQGKRIMAVHGADDQNVPIAGGRGTKGISGVTFKSQVSSKTIFDNSGARYDLIIVPNADHGLRNIDAQIKASDGVSLSEKAVQFFGIPKMQ